MTTLQREREEQARWLPRPGVAPVILQCFQELVDHEFLPHEAHRQAQDAALRQVVQFAAVSVPYYSLLLMQAGLSAADIAGVVDLPRLPVMTRRVLLDNETLLRASQLPPGQGLFGPAHSSGTTGRRTTVWHSHISNRMFTLLTQRRLRWARFDPSATYCDIRAPGLLPPTDAGTPADPDLVLHKRTWRYVGRFYETGPYLAFTIHHPLARWRQWIAEHDPAYIHSYSGVLEELAFACVDQPPCPGLRGAISVASQVTPAMRQRIEQTFGVPLHEGYGLNEIGFVAIRCEAGRFHVNREHCIVEIVDEQGRPCAAGESGRIVVTALRNLAMPLLRYDTDDTAAWAAGDCLCGRTLPSFERLSGRVRRYATLPPGTRPRFNAVADALETAPPQWLRHLERYQLHQYRDGRFELRVVVAQPLPAGLVERLHETWSRVGDQNWAPAALSIVTVKAIPLGPGGKRLDFTSDYFEDADATR